MNHLREILDHDAITFDTPPCSPSSIREVVIKIARVLPSAQCFWVGDWTGVCELNVVPEIARLPFDVVWLEGEWVSKYGKVFAGIAAVNLQNGQTGAIGFHRRGDSPHIWEAIWVSRFDMASGSGSVLCHDNEIGMIAKAEMQAVRAFCCAINCTNVLRREHQPEPKLQKARARRGKAPLFSYWTLELNGRGALRTPDQGGAHASPRVHLRRGHPRQYAPGKWTWVQAHAVGNRAAGMVHKDYSAGPGLKAQ